MVSNLDGQYWDDADKQPHWLFVWNIDKPISTLFWCSSQYNRKALRFQYTPSPRKDVDSFR